MDETRCETLEEIVAARSAYGDDTLLCFRGQADQGWALVPKIHRHLQRLAPPVEAEDFPELARIERDVYREFERGAHGRAEVADPWQRLCLAQHHGVPTRLLDWTTSVQTGAYFAVTGEPEKDAAIWILTASGLPVPKELGRLARDSAYRPSAIARLVPPDEISFFDERSETTSDHDAPTHAFMAVIQTPPNPRIERQHGVFSVYITTKDTNLVWDHGLHIRRIEGELGVPLLRRIVIPRARKSFIRRQLKREGVDAYHLFPDLEGLSLHLTDYLAERVGRLR